MNGAMRLKIGLRVRGMTIDELSERTGIVSLIIYNCVTIGTECFFVV